MIKLFLILNLTFFVLLCNAQQTLFLEKMSNGKIKTIKLPCVGRVKFKNGVDKKLLLQKISGDSFYFKKYYNQPENYDCSIDSISKIFFPQQNQYRLYTAFGAIAGFGLFIVPFTIYYSLHQAGEPGNPTQFLAVVFGIPFSLVTIISSVAIVSKLPENYSTSKWRFYAK